MKVETDEAIVIIICVYMLGIATALIARWIREEYRHYKHSRKIEQDKRTDFRLPKHGYHMEDDNE